MEGITFINHFINDPEALFKTLLVKVNWDERMHTRKTASYGVAYNYAQISYPYQDFIPELFPIIDLLEKTLRFRPNNCLINYYPDGTSRMGYHSDQTDILEQNTGIAIISLGDERTLRFRSIENKDDKRDFPLPQGSMIYMTQEMQHNWQHAVPKSSSLQERMSLTFRWIL